MNIVEILYIFLKISSFLFCVIQSTRLTVIEFLGHLEVSKQLFEERADMEAENNEDWTILNHFSRHGN